MTQTNTTQNKEELESQKFLVIHSNKLSTKETKVPKDFIPLFIREYSGKDGEQVFIKDHLIANSKKESWEEIQQRERFQQTLEFLFDASRGQKQVFLEELSILWAKELSQAHQSGIEEERKRIAPIIYSIMANCPISGIFKRNRDEFKKLYESLKETNNEHF